MAFRYGWLFYFALITFVINLINAVGSVEKISFVKCRFVGGSYWWYSDALQPPSPSLGITSMVGKWLRFTVCQISTLHVQFLQILCFNYVSAETRVC